VGGGGEGGLGKQCSYMYRVQGPYTERIGLLFELFFVKESGV
jgi:hypothetical protein